MSTVDLPAVQRLSLGSAGISMTLDEFDSVTDWDKDYNYELIHGVLVVTPFAGPPELFPNDLLGHRLREYQEQTAPSSPLISTVYEFYLTAGENRRRADRVVWTKVGSQGADPASTFPTIVIEFVSAGKAAWRRDHIEKRDEYLAAGAREYWVFDRFARTLTVSAIKGGTAVETIIHEKESYSTDLLPGFELRLAELLAAADQWGEKNPPSE